MTPERWQQVEEILQAAIDRPRHERALYLDKACAGDNELRNEADSLLRAVDQSGEFIEQPAIAVDASVLARVTPDSNIGRTIGSYNIVKRLGAGGMGEVYLAQDARLGRHVALKVLPSNLVFDQDRLNRFQREARAASALNHPNILTIHEVGELGSVHFIATEFIDGQTLSEVNAARSLSIKEVLEIAIQVASALAAAHEAGIVHRDIKPENIMLRKDGIIKILDFGIAKLTEPSPPEDSSETPDPVVTQTETGVVMGTPRYMSPEQARGFSVDEGTDIWSFGVVLYEMIARRPPFVRATRLDTLVEILEREPPRLDSLTSNNYQVFPQLQEIVSKALRKIRSERYQTVAELLVDLRAVKQHYDVTALLSPHSASTGTVDDNDNSTDKRATSTELPSAMFGSASQRRTAFLQRRPVLAGLLVATLLLTAIGGTFIYRRNRTERETIKPIAENPTGAPTKIYAQMNESEKLSYIKSQEQSVSAMMGDRPVELNEEALKAIKARIDRYVARIGSNSNQLGKEDINIIYARAAPFVPLIARSFAERKVPTIIGIYLPMIESEYVTCAENYTGAKGLFQFLPQTARAYGVAQEEMCDVSKMTPAAAHYIADRMAELGDDAQSMTLVLLSYNIGADGVRNALRELRNTENFERNFWTLFANRSKIDERFQNEGAMYVPSFFAAAIIGENPGAFGLQNPPLSTLVEAGAR